MTGEEFVDLDAIERYCRDHPDYHCDLPTEQVLNLIRMAKMRDREPSPILADVQAELKRAMKKFGAFHDAHHGKAIIEEEFDELWDEIKLKKPSVLVMRKEAVQLAAMAVRFIQDVCDRQQTGVDWSTQVDGNPHP